MWAKERKTQGWRYGKERDTRRKLHPLLVPFHLLPEKVRWGLLGVVCRARFPGDVHLSVSVCTVCSRAGSPQGPFPPIVAGMCFGIPGTVYVLSNIGLCDLSRGLASVSAGPEMGQDFRRGLPEADHRAGIPPAKDRRVGSWRQTRCGWGRVCGLSSATHPTSSPPPPTLDGKP